MKSSYIFTFLLFALTGYLACATENYEREFAAGIVVYHRSQDQAEYLLLHYQAGHWDLAKGHVEAGETNEQAAHRELLEETGLTATLIPDFKKSFNYWLNHYITQKRIFKTVTFFAGETNSKKIILSDEHQDYKWLPYQEAMKQLTYDNARMLLKEVHELLGSFSSH